MTTTSRRLAAVVLGLVAPAVLVSAGLSQDIYDFTGARDADGALVPGAPHATTDLTHGDRFSINVQRLERIPRTALPAGCELASGPEAVVLLHVTLRNLESHPFRGIVEHLVLVFRDRFNRIDGRDAIDRTCGLGDPQASYLGDIDPIPPRGQRRVRLLYTVPVGVRPLRLDYTNDDFPVHFALPRGAAAALARP